MIDDDMWDIHDSHSKSLYLPELKKGNNEEYEKILKELAKDINGLKQVHNFIHIFFFVSFL